MKLPSSEDGVGKTSQVVLNVYFLNVYCYAPIHPQKQPQKATEAPSAVNIGIWVGSKIPQLMYFWWSQHTKPQSKLNQFLPD